MNNEQQPSPPVQAPSILTATNIKIMKVTTSMDAMASDTIKVLQANSSPNSCFQSDESDQGGITELNLCHNAQVVANQNVTQDISKIANSNTISNGNIKPKDKLEASDTLTNGGEEIFLCSTVTTSKQRLQEVMKKRSCSQLANGSCFQKSDEENSPIKQKMNADISSSSNGDISCSISDCSNGERSSPLPEHTPTINGRNTDNDHKKEEMEYHLDAADWDRTVAEVKEQAFARLQEELNKAHQELRLRDEEVNRLSRIREEVEAELEELTASLFQEAHNMVREANIRQAAAERSLKESQMQVEVLTAEVAALKALVLTSTPSRPNPHLHPQISTHRDDSSLSGVGLFTRKHRRSPSHFNLKYGRESSPPESPVKEQRTLVPETLENKDGCEVDPIVHKEFVAWKQCPRMDKSDAFISRVYSEDINLCLNFNNKELGARVQAAVEAGDIFIEAVSDKSKTVFPKKCALLEVPRQCHYRMRLGNEEQWHSISQICRNRIIAVCDFLNYLRYIERGLVKSSVHDVYWEMTRLRKEMVLARLGLTLSV